MHVTTTGAARSRGRRPPIQCVRIPDETHAVLLDSEHECLVPAALVERSDHAGKIISLHGRRIVTDCDSSSVIRLAPRLVVCGRGVIPLIAAADHAIWERFDTALNEPVCVVAADWLSRTPNQVIHSLSDSERHVLLIAIGSHGQLLIGPIFSPAALLTGWNRLRAHLRQARPLRGYLFDRVGGLPDLQPAGNANQVKESLQRFTALLLRWAAPRLLPHGVLDVTPGKPARLHRLLHPALASRQADPLLRPARRWISPLTGPVYRLHTSPHASLPDLSIVNAEAADCRGWTSITALKRSMVNRGGGGCAEHPDSAMRAAIGEAFERLAAVDTDSHQGMLAPANTLNHCYAWSCLAPIANGQPGIDGRRLPAARHAIPPTVADNQTIEWLQTRQLGAVDRCWLPRTYLLFGDDGSDQPLAHSDGLAVAAGRRQAVQRGLLELIERDAVGIWWHGRFLRPSAPTQAWQAPVVKHCVEHLQQQGRRVHLLDLSHDLGVPVVAAISADQQGQRLVVGAAARLSFEAAGRAAVLEMAQMEPMAALPDAQLEQSEREWRELANLDDCPWMVPQRRSHATVSDRPTFGRVLQALRTNRLAVIWLDLTQPWMPVAAVRVVVPGLCSHRPILGFERLLAVPDRMGWRSASRHVSRPLQLYW